MRRVARWFLTMVAIAGPALVVCLVLSPRFGESLFGWADDALRVQARVSSCAPHRDGIHHRTEVVCRFTYDFDGESHVADSAGWSRQDPFLTSAGLERAVLEQGARMTRVATVRRAYPSDAALADERWLAMPPLWAWLLILFVALGAAIVRLDPSDLPYRRADLAPDPSTGYLEPINHHRRDRIRRRLAGQGLAVLLAGLICLFGVSNRPANLAARLGMTALTPVPARLVDCAHRYYRASRGGHDQLDCDVVYTVGGRAYRGSAESLRFGLIPTTARMEAEVARLRSRPVVTAYVDRRHPGYAWAFISDRAFVPFTWGLFELELWILLVVTGGVVVASIVRWNRAC